MVPDMAPKANGTVEPRYNVLFTNPRSASHLLTTILNLPNQSSVHRHPEDGYIFIRSSLMRLKRGIGGKPVSQWTAHDKKTVEYAFQKSYDEFAQWRQDAAKLGKGAFLKIHCMDIVEPVSETKWIHGANLIKDVAAWPTCSTSGRRRFGLKNGDSNGIDFRSEGNETCLSDAVLKSWRPTFLIRHPALVFPSVVRADLDVGFDVILNAPKDSDNEGLMQAWAHAKTWELTFHWQRQLLDWYLNQLTEEEKESGHTCVKFPVVIDADDIQSPTAPELMRKYAQAVGLDPDNVRFEWSAAKKQDVNEMNIFEQRLLDTINASTGIVPGKTAKGIDLDEEKFKWKTQFGEDFGGKVGQWVEDAIPDYDWMRQYRLQL